MNTCVIIMIFILKFLSFNIDTILFLKLSFVILLIQNQKFYDLKKVLKLSFINNSKHIDLLSVNKTSSVYLFIKMEVFLLNIM